MTNDTKTLKKPYRCMEKEYFLMVLTSINISMLTLVHTTEKLNKINMGKVNIMFNNSKNYFYYIIIIYLLFLYTQKEITTTNMQHTVVMLCSEMTIIYLIHMRYCTSNSIFKDLNSMF